MPVGPWFHLHAIAVVDILLSGAAGWLLGWANGPSSALVSQAQKTGGTLTLHLTRRRPFEMIDHDQHDSQVVKLEGAFQQDNRG